MHVTMHCRAQLQRTRWTTRSAHSATTLGAIKHEAYRQVIESESQHFAHARVQALALSGLYWRFPCLMTP